ncbi:MAG: ABC transporter permease [Proteobacteria bacterium]|nr:ABC transporter permease [Pseudomonadota bacterium]
MSGTGFVARLWSLVKKETRQLLRDRSNVAIGLVLPLVLILLFGYGISLDVKQASVAVVLEDASPQVDDVLAGLRLTPYIAPVVTRSMREAETLMQDHRIDAILRIPSDFSRRLAAGQAAAQLVVNGADASTARAVESYVTGALMRGAGPAAGVSVEPRLWFNDANTSTWYLVPGLIVLIMTLVGAFLTSLVVAREWERGTFEALFVSPVRPAEILLAKIVPYFCVGMIGFAMCLASARWLFDVPIVGSLALLVLASVLYLLVALGTGLLISSATKNQFLASQIALLSSFLPALMLSGFLFDLRNVPVVVRAVANVLPATHYLALIKTLFLAGDVWSIVVPKLLLLALYAAVLLAAARAVTRKRIA